MAMTDAERRAYARGYQVRAERWPQHRPPIPPDPIVGALVSALRSIRDECDSVCATFYPDDEVFIQLGKQIDRADEALMMITAWLAAGKLPDLPRNAGVKEGSNGS